MGKSSSSLKKKRSRNRSQSRALKKSKSKSKSKSRRNKSKKLRHRNHSVSYSDDSDSTSLVSVSSSSSEDDYASQRSRSRTRKDVKGSKKRVRRRSLNSSESSLDSFRGRKQKRSRSTRRVDSHERKKRTHLRKKPRRGVSVSSASSGSRSCSTCRSGSSNSSDESEFERRGKSERKEKPRKRFGKLKTGTKKGRDRSRSCSSCSRYSEFSEHQSEEKVVEQNNSRRLRSVITVINAEKEEIELEGDEHKEEILYDHDDYLSSKSNDSNDGDIRREFSQHSHLASEKNKDVDDEHGEKTDASNFRAGSVVGSGKNGVSSCDLVGKNDAKEERKSEASGAVGSLDGDDLESILRQRALENLRKFRGGMQTNLNIPANQEGKSNANVNTPSKEKAESVRLKSSTREDGARVVTASQVLPQFRLPATRKDSSGLPHDGKILEGGDGGKGSQTAEHDVASARDKVALACSPKEKVNVASSSVSIKPRALRREFTNTTRSVSIKPRALRREFTNTTLKQSSASQEHSQAMSMPRSEGNESAEKPPQSGESQSDNKNGDKIKNVHDSTGDGPSSSLGSVLADVSSDKLQDGTKEGSQFEQKTMSVMRGGELVEVSYKVYIPKKAPALARRQLKR